MAALSGSLYGFMKYMSSRYVLSATAFSPALNSDVNLTLAYFKSEYLSQCNPPKAHTISPDLMHKAISYRTPGPLILWEYHFGSNGVGSWIGQSAPSIDVNEVA